MPIITLTSDLGTKDYYLAAVKAAALKAIPHVDLIDISNHIPPFNIAKAAFVLRNVWHEFPEGTIHLIGVDSHWSKSTPYVIVEKAGHTFIGTDNGTFSLLFDGEPADAVYSANLSGDEALAFPLKDIFIPIAGQLIAGLKPHQIGELMDSYKHRPSLNPVVEHDNIRGTVIYIDAYGNVITNITRALFEREVNGRSFNVVVRRGDDDLDKISRAYWEVPEGEKVALFTSSGYLEIAINRGVDGSGGGASDLLGIRENDIVRIEIGD
jgi:S-adenosylmethionine hydrolase